MPKYVLKENEKLTVNPGMEKKWVKAVSVNQDDYGHAIVEATVCVGKALDKGKSCKQAEKACHKLDMSGFMAGCMAHWISIFHPRGEEFRAWWNKETQVNGEGEKATKEKKTLNPALVSISA